MNYSKYKSKKVKVDGLLFDSKLEYNIYKELKNNDNIIFTRQEEFQLLEKFKIGNKTFRETKYIADFVIYTKNGNYIIDAKGMETPVFKLKAKLFAFKYKKEIIIIKSVKQLKLWLEKEGL